MKTLAFLVVMILPGIVAMGQPTRQYDVAFSTYLGGSKFDAARDVCVDHAGNIIVVGGTSSPDFPVTARAFQKTLTKSTEPGSASRLGDTDAYIAKFTPAGKLLWATYLGGPGYDRAYGVEVDSHDRIFVCGRAGPGFPTTANSFQPQFISTASTEADFSKAEYGDQNGFITCFTPEGKQVWGAYNWYCELTRDVVIDDAGDVYITSGWNGNGNKPPDFPSGFCVAPKLTGNRNTRRGFGDVAVIKIKGDGSKILWGSWLCGSGLEAAAASIRLDADRNVYYMVAARSTDMPFNPADKGRHSHAKDGGKTDIYLAKLSADGKTLIYGTYLGGNDEDDLDTHQLAIDPKGNAYVAIASRSTDQPVTPGVFQSKFPGGAPVVVYKVDSTGALVLCAYVGGSKPQPVEGVSVDADGNVYVTGSSFSPDFPVTEKAYQSKYPPDTPFVDQTTGKAIDGKISAEGGFFIVLSADFKSLLYSTNYGHGASIRRTDGKPVNAYGGLHSSTLAPDGSFIAVGTWFSDGFPLVKPFQDKFKPGTLRGDIHLDHTDAVIVRFVPGAIDKK